MKSIKNLCIPGTVSNSAFKKKLLFYGWGNMCKDRTRIKTLTTEFGIHNNLNEQLEPAYIPKTTGWAFRGTNSVRGKRIFYSQKCSERRWGPSSYSVTTAAFSGGWRGRGMMLTNPPPPPPPTPKKKKGGRPPPPPPPLFLTPKPPPPPPGLGS